MIMRDPCTSQSGSVITILLSAVAISGALMTAVYSTLSGPIRTASLVSNTEKVRADIATNAKNLMGLATPGPVDSVLLPPAFDPLGTVKPTGGGNVPTGVGVATDPWGTRYGYCAWDHGSNTAAPNRIPGINPGYEAADIVRIISAGPNRTFESSCVATAGDDIARGYSLNNITAAGGADFWEKDTADAEVIRYGTAGGVLIGPNTPTLTGDDLQVNGDAYFGGGVSVSGALTSVAGITGTAIGAVTPADGVFTNVTATGVNLTNLLQSNIANANVFQTNILNATAAATTTIVGGLNADELDGEDGLFIRDLENFTAGRLPKERLPSFSGDAVSTGGIGIFTVERIRGQNYWNTAPTTGHSLIWSGQWISGYPRLASTYVSGPSNAVVISGFRTHSMTSAAPNVGDVIGHNGLAWAPMAVSATGAGVIVPSGANFLATSTGITAGTCVAGEVAKYDGANWSCDTDNGGGGLMLPFEVGAATGGRIMTINGGANVFMGFKANRNEFFGTDAGYALSIASSPAAASGTVSIGTNAMRESNNALNTLVIGHEALRTRAAAHNVSVVIGNNAANDKQVSQSVIIGHDAAIESSASLVNSAVAIGHNVINGITTASSITAIGDNAMYRITTATGATAIGARSLYNIISGTGNTGIGYRALQGSPVAPYMTGANNTAIGKDAGSNMTSTSNSTYIGQDAGFSSTGANHLAMGYRALYTLSTGTGNTVIGYQAGFNVRSSAQAVAIGANALYGGPGAGAFANIAIGRDALYNVETGTGARNLAIGTFALNNVNFGGDNVGIGLNALSGATNSPVNTAIGAFAMTGPITAASGYNTAVGYFSLANMSAGGGNTAAGAFSMADISTGGFNTAIGYGALYGSGINPNIGESNVAVGQALGNNESGSRNTAIGLVALGNNFTGNDNLAVGFGALGSNESGNENTAIGVGVLGNITTQSFNTAVGDGAMSAGTGNYNLAIGTGAMNNSSGDYNIGIGRLALRFNQVNEGLAIGERALFQQTTGLRNLAIGTTTLGGLTTGNDNIGIGEQALANIAATGANQNIGVGSQTLSIVTGSGNVAVGDQALRQVTAGTNNVAVGESALFGLSTGGHNVAIGNDAGSVSTGNHNVAIGVFANVWATGLGSVAVGNNAYSDIGVNIVIGNNAQSIGTDNIMIGNNNTVFGPQNNLIVIGHGLPIVMAANRLVIGNAANGNVLQGSMATGNMTLKGTLTAPSDMRMKKNIKSLDGSLGKIMALSPVTYKWKTEYKKDEHIYVGFIAQDVQKIIPEIVFETESDNVVKDMLTISYDHMAPILVEGIKEQDIALDILQDDIDQLRTIITEKAKQVAR